MHANVVHVAQKYSEPDTAEIGGSAEGPEPPTFGEQNRLITSNQKLTNIWHARPLPYLLPFRSFYHTPRPLSTLGHAQHRVVHNRIFLATRNAIHHTIRC